VREETTELPSTDVQKTVDEVKSVNIADASSQPSYVDGMKLQDQDNLHLSFETNTNINDVSVDNSNADGPNLQESVKYVPLEVELPGNLTDVYEICKEFATDKPFALAHSTPLPASENQNTYVDADQTEFSLEVHEELEHTEIGEIHENDTETEGSAQDKQVDTHRGNANTEGLLSSDHSVEGKEVIFGGGEIINSVVGNA
jgi:hypothetical protein